MLHERNRASRHEVHTLWSLADVARQTLAFAVHDEAERRAYAKMKSDADLKRTQRELNGS